MVDLGEYVAWTRRYSAPFSAGYLRRKACAAAERRARSLEIIRRDSADIIPSDSAKRVHRDSAGVTANTPAYRTRAKAGRASGALRWSSASCPLLAMFVLLGGCGTANPTATFVPDPGATGGAHTGSEHTGSGGRGAALVWPQGGDAAVAGSTQAPPFEFVDLDIEAETVGPGYRFTKWYGEWDLAILAQGDGPSVVVMVNGCEPPRLYTVPMPDDSFEVALLGLLQSDQPVALVCNPDRCLLEAAVESASDASQIRSELVPIPESETTPGDWRHLETRGYAGDRQLCLVSPTAKRCLGANGWLPDEAFSLPDAPDLAPLCPDLVLNDYEHRWGVTAEGRLVQVQTGALGETNCLYRSEPLGAPLALFLPVCGNAENLWLLTQRRLDRVGPCSCSID